MQPSATRPLASLQLAAFTRLLLLLCAFGFILVGCGGGGGKNGSGSSSATVVRGTVLDSADSDRTVQGATVTIGGVTAKTRTVDNADSTHLVGSFEISGAKNGSNTAVITPVGGTAQTVAFLPAVATGQTVEVELNINIGQVRGRVLLPNGQPAASAFVTVSTSTNIDTVQTGTDGTFLVTLVLPGDASISVVQGTASAQKTVTVTNGLTEVGDIALVDNPNVNPPGLPVTLTGRVGIPGGLFPAGTNVILTRNDVQIESTVTDTNGTYSFYVPIGTYGLRFLRDGFVQQDRANVTITTPSTPLTIEDIQLTEVQ